MRMRWTTFSLPLRASDRTQSQGRAARHQLLKTHGTVWDDEGMTTDECLSVTLMRQLAMPQCGAGLPYTRKAESQIKHHAMDSQARPTQMRTHASRGLTLSNLPCYPSLSGPKNAQIPKYTSNLQIGPRVAAVVGFPPPLVIVYINHPTTRSAHVAVPTRAPNFHGRKRRMRARRAETSHHSRRW